MGALLASCWFQPVASNAQERADSALPPARRITLAEALAGFEQANPELRIAREDLAAARARVAAVVRPNPVLSLTREQLRGDGSLAGQQLRADGRNYQETTLSAGQTLEIGGQRGLRRRVAEREVEAAEARLAAERLRLGLAVRRVYVRAAAAEARLGTVRTAAEVFRTVERAGTARLREGDLSRYDLQRLRVERARSETLLADARLELLGTGRELALLVNSDSVRATIPLLPADPLDLARLEEIELPDSALAAALARADVRAAASEVEAARAGVELQQRRRIPDLTLSVGYKNQGDGFQGVVLGASLPVPLWDRNRGGIAEAEALRAGAEARYALALRNAEADVLRAAERVRSLRARAALLDEGQLADSDGLLTTARVAYAEGEMSLLELLDAAEAFRTARQTRTELLAESLLAVYELQRATAGLDAAAPATPDLP